MKHNIFINIIIVAIFAAMISGCQKEQPADIKKHPIEINNHSKMLIQKFDYFRNKMQSQLKSGESISLDSAIWYTEATLSYDNAYPDSISEDFFTVNTYYTLNVDNNNMVSMEDVQNVYNLMLDSLNYHLGQINEDVKFIAFADVQLNGIKNNVANIQMISGFGTGLVLGYYDPFEEDDDWIWGTTGMDDLQGKCDGTMSGASDASNELQYRFNHPYLQPTYEPYYTDYYTITKHLVEKNGEYVTFETYDYNYCIQDDEMNFLLTEGHKLIYNSPSDPDFGFCPSDKVFVSIEIVDTIFLGDGSLTYYIHVYTITYAKPGGTPPTN